jgi:hypothetical protein
MGGWTKTCGCYSNSIISHLIIIFITLTQTEGCMHEVIYQ